MTGKTDGRCTEVNGQAITGRALFEPENLKRRPETNAAQRDVTRGDSLALELQADSHGTESIAAYLVDAYISQTS
jgi:hypothetical protein